MNAVSFGCHVFYQAVLAMDMSMISVAIPSPAGKEIWSNSNNGSSDKWWLLLI